jgi:hypothetical protein
VVNFAKVKREENLAMSPADTTPPQSPADPGVLPKEPKSSDFASSTLWLGLLSLVASAFATYIFHAFLPSMCVVGVVALPAVVVGILAWVDVGRSKGTRQGRGKAVLGIAAAGLAVAVTGVVIPGIRTKAAKLQSENNLKEMCIAMHEYHGSYYDSLPPAVFTQPVDPFGKIPPPYSWRVALLPYFRFEKDAEKLYNQYHFDEPWDSPNNQKLLSEMPHFYASPGKNPANAKGLTYYQVLVGPRTAFERNQKITFAGLNKLNKMDTILIVEAAEPVPWTKPEDIPYDPDQAVPQLGGLFPDGFHVVFADGTVKWVRRTKDPEALRALIHR